LIAPPWKGLLVGPIQTCRELRHAQAVDSGAAAI
jgi:hypothetical protein